MRKESSKLSRPGESPSAASDVPATAVGGISRRDFVKKGSGALLVTSFGCGDGTSPTATGTIRLLLTGLHSSATSGGTATVTPALGGTVVTINVPAAGDQSATVPAGTYSVVYTPPANHQLAAGQTVPSTVTITEGQTTTVAISLVASGSIQVTVSGLTGSPANGGTASAQRTDAAGTAIPITVSSSGTGTATGVPVGTYSVTYTPPSGFNVSGTNPATGVTVNPGAAAGVGFTVSAVAQTGSIHIVANGLSGASSGGSVSARLSNQTGNTFTANLSTPSGGSSAADLTGMPVGSYDVTYTPPGGYRVTSGTQNPQLVAVTASASANATYVAELIPPSSGTVLFVSNFGTALGTTTAAKSDGGKWNLLGGTGQEVVATTGLDFPSANVCKFNALRSNLGFALNRKTGLPPLAVGVTRYYRWYVRMTFPDALVGNGDHPWQDGNAVSDCNWIVGVHYGSDVGAARNGQWQVGPTFLGNANGQFDNGPWLNKGQTYRIECALDRVSTTTYEFSIRVYNSSGTLLFSDPNFVPDSGNGTLATLGPWTFRNANNLDGLNCGTNDFEAAGNDWWTTSFDYSYQGCFAVKDGGDWIGPYGSLAGET